MLKRPFHFKFRSSHLLAVLFILFIFYVGLATFPDFFNFTVETLRGQHSIGNYIEQVDEQYSGMLETDPAFSLLQNKGTYINLNGLVAKKMGQVLMNERVTLKNNHQTRINSESPAPEDIQKAADNIIRFHNAHTASGGNFLFVMVSTQISKYEDLLPVGYSDTTNASADTFLDLLAQAGVPYLDLREEMHKDGMSVTDAYFATDHHWKPQTAFWAYGKTLEKLAQMGAIGPVDSFYTDPENYTFITYPDTFLGSSGKRTGSYFAGVDDSIFIRPDFATDIHVNIPQWGIDLQGPYEEVSYNSDVFHDFQNLGLYQSNCYSYYGWSDTAITHWRNENAPEQSKFLLIGESFGNIPFNLMSIYASSCDEMDLRLYDGDFSEYYHAYAPDTVIVEFSVRSVISDFTKYQYLG